MIDDQNLNNEKIRIHKNRPTRVIFSFLAVVGLAWLSFGAGLYFAGQNQVLADLAKKEAVYIGKLTGKYSEAESGFITQDIDFGLFWETWDVLRQNYVDKEAISEKKLFYGALRGMVAAVGDPYTVFMDPKIAHEFSEDLSGTFEGIGAEIGIKNEILTIIAPLPDMPAEKAGLKAGDKVLMIDGEPTLGISVDEAVTRIRGPKNTEVTLTVRRDGEDSSREITIERNKIVVKSLRTEMKENGLFVIRITNFNEDSKNLFNEAVREVLAADPQGIILDLRNNPGGYLEASIKIASEWVESNTVVIERYGSNEFGDPIQNEHLSRGRARLKDFPTVVLVNQGSASASEIVAGALQDHELAKVVGKQTFGKGSVQSLSMLADGSSVKVTVAKWLTPGGRAIDDEGITPDMEIDLSEKDYNDDRDPQMEYAEALLLGHDLPETSAQTATSAAEMIND